MDRVIKYTTASLLIAIPLYPKFPLISVPGTFVSIRLEDLLVGFSLLVAIWYFVKTKSVGKILKNKIIQAMLLFLLVGFLSYLSSIFITKTAPVTIGFLHWLRRVEYFIPFLLGYVAIRNDRRNIIFFINILLIVVVISFIYGYGQKYYSWPIVITQNEEYSRGVALRYVPGGHINSTFAGHYDLGTFLVLILPLFISLVAIIKNLKFRVLYFCGFLLGLWLLTSSASRVSLAAYLVSSLLALILLKRKIFIPFLLLITFAVAFTSNNLVARYKRIIEVSQQRIEQFNLLNYVVSPIRAQERIVLPSKVVSTPTPTSVPVFEDRSSNIRLNVEWPRAIRAFNKNPLLGTGYSSITLATDNDYLRLLGEVGILGFLSFLLILFRIGIQYLSKYPFAAHFHNVELTYLAVTFAAVPGILINAIFIDVFEASKFAILFWLMIGFAMGLLSRKKVEKST